jgi:hypothetical protein
MRGSLRVTKRPSFEAGPGGNGVAVGVGVGAGVAVSVGGGVADAVAVAPAVAVAAVVGVASGLNGFVGVASGETPEVGVPVGVDVTRGVRVGVGVGAGERAPHPAAAAIAPIPANSRRKALRLSPGPGLFWLCFVIRYLRRATVLALPLIASEIS